MFDWSHCNRSAHSITFFIIVQYRCLNIICKMPSVSSPTLIHVLSNSNRVLFSRYFLLAEWGDGISVKYRRWEPDFSPTRLKSVSFTQHVSSYTVVEIQTSSTQKNHNVRHSFRDESFNNCYCTIFTFNPSLHQESPIELYIAITKSARLY